MLKLLQKVNFQTNFIQYNKKNNILLYNKQKIKSRKMLRASSSTLLIQQKPRKKLKLDTVYEKIYNEFEGSIEQEYQTVPDQTGKNQYVNQNFKESNNQIPIEREIEDNQRIFQLISKEGVKCRRVNEDKKGAKIEDQSKGKDNKMNSSDLKLVKKQNVKINQSDMKIKFQEGNQPKIQNSQNLNKDKKKQNQKNKNSKSKPKQDTPASSNWQKFLQNKQNQNPANKFSQSQKGTNSSKQTTSITKNQNSSHTFVAIDCEFVKCGQQDHLARISLVNQNAQTIYDSYIKPQKRVTDYITNITGITFSHLKNAPLWTQQIAKVKKLMLGKIIVGHTLHKDLEVTGLDKWKGISRKIDISQYLPYKQKGGSKIVSLKRLAASFLNKNIQQGWHSSVEDAVVTMNLFKINKKKILKQFKFI